MAAPAHGPGPSHVPPTKGSGGSLPLALIAKLIGAVSVLVGLYFLWFCLAKHDLVVYVVGPVIMAVLLVVVVVMDFAGSYLWDLIKSPWKVHESHGDPKLYWYLSKTWLFAAIVLVLGEYMGSYLEAFGVIGSIVILWIAAKRWLFPAVTRTWKRWVEYTPESRLGEAVHWGTTKPDVLFRRGLAVLLAVVSLGTVASTVAIVAFVFLYFNAIPGVNVDLSFTREPIRTFIENRIDDADYYGDRWNARTREWSRYSVRHGKK